MLQIPNPHFNIYDDVPEDEAVYDSLRTSKSNVGVFQLGQRQAAHLCHMYKQITSLKDISALSSLLRPGMSDVKDDKGRPITECYIARRNGEEDVEYHHPSLEPVLQGTYGFLLFQESALFVARQVAGFDLQKADILRVAIGKKQVDKMKGLRNDFVTGCKATSGIDEGVANKIFDDISASGRYSFNRSHAASYAKNAYIDLYFRYYYPEVFYAAQLAYAVEKSASKDKAVELINGLIAAADEQFGIKVYPPSLGERYLYTTPITSADRKYIRLGFRHIIGFGSADNIQKMFKAVDDITATLGCKSILYVSWIEILFYYSKKIGKTMMEALIKIGCFAHLGGTDNRRLQWHEYKQFLKLSEKEVKWITVNILSGNKNPKEVSLQWCIEAMLQSNGTMKTRIDTVTVVVNELKNSPSGTSSTWKRLSEKALLYRAFSSPVTDEYEGVATAFLDERHGNEERVFVLYIEEVVIGEQKNGLKYARVKCVDEHDTAGTCMVFGREYPLYHQFLQQNEIIQVQGKIKHDEYGATVIASNVK